MTVAELAAHLLRLPNQHAAVCLPPSEHDDGFAFADPHEVVGTSRWEDTYVGGHGLVPALIRGPYVRIDAVED